MKILFVCTGNTCRSPMAEALLKNRMPEAKVKSAGIFAGWNQRANDNAIRALKERNINMDHKTQPVTEDLLLWADVVLTMTSQHKQALVLDFPNYQEKYFTLKEYVSDSDKEVWDQLKKAYADLEEKRLQITQQNRNLPEDQLEKIIEKKLQDDILRIRSLESNLINYDISDPFGGDLSVYQKTLNELDEQIDMLMKKMRKSSN